MIKEKKLKAILFDLDGTILNTRADITYAVNSALLKANLEEISEDLCISYVGRGLFRALSDILRDKNFKVTEEELALLYEELLYTYRKYPYQRAVIYDGISNLLNFLVERDVEIGILSNKEDELIQIIAKEVFSDVPFSFIRGSSVDYPSKPDAHSVLEFASLHKHKLENIMLVGDTVVDYQTAVNANIHKAIVTWGFRSREELTLAGCSPLYDTIDKLKEEIIKWI
jgi:phosphoglycolate phosphatase